MKQSIVHVALVVRDYDEAIAFFTRTLRFVLVEDVVSSGGAIIDAMTLLKGDGLVPTAALCVIDRSTGGREALAEHGLPLHALFTMAQIESG